MNPDSYHESSETELPAGADGLRSKIADLESTLEDFERETSSHAGEVLDLVIHSLDEIIASEREI